MMRCCGATASLLGPNFDGVRCNCGTLAMHLVYMYKGTHSRARAQTLLQILTLGARISFGWCLNIQTHRVQTIWYTTIRGEQRTVHLPENKGK